MPQKKYTVTDGKLVLVLEVAEEGGYVVTAPFHQGVNTQAESVEEAFEMARDAIALLKPARRKPAPAAKGPRRKRAVAA